MGIDERWSPEGLGELRTLYGPLRRFAAVIGRWDVEPDDLVQEAYARVLRRREIEIEDLGPYLRRTIVNLATDERRRARKGAEVVQQLRPAPRGDDYPSELTELLRLPERVPRAAVPRGRRRHAIERRGGARRDVPAVGAGRTDAGPATASCGAECGVER